MLLSKKPFKDCLDPPPAPLKKGGEFEFFPFLRGIEGDLLELLTAESNS
jgi:hypothetical protein